MEQNFLGKIVLITGGNSGIGKACAAEFSKKGAHVLLVGRNQKANELVENEIHAKGFTATSYVADVSKEEEVKRLLETIEKRFNHMDFLINSAGILGPHGKVLHEYDYKDWKNVIETNLDGVWLCMKYGMPLLLKSEKPAVVNLGSVLGLQGKFDGDACVASKHAVIGLTRSAARQYGRKNIRINAVCPGSINTPMLLNSGPPELINGLVEHLVPAGRRGEPEEVAQLIAWLCSEESCYITGAAITVDGGFTA